MELWRSIVLPAVAPFVVAFAALLPTALVGRRRGEGGEFRPLKVPLSGAIAVGGGYAVGSSLISGLPQWPAISADERLLWIVLLVALVVGAWHVLRAPFALVPVVAFAGGAAWWMLERSLEHLYPGRDGWILIGVVAASLVVTAQGLAALSRRRPGFVTPALLVLVASVAAGVLVLGKTAKLGQFSGALASALAGAALIALWRRELVIAGGATAAFAFGLVGLIAVGVVYNEVPLIAGALIVASVLTPAFAELPGLRSVSPRAHGLLRVVLTLVPLAAALWLTWQAQPPAYDY